jgi:hypothetical protein
VKPESRSWTPPQIHLNLVPIIAGPINASKVPA